METVRRRQSPLLGYPIDLLEQHDARGRIKRRWVEVLAPETLALLHRCVDLAAAERYVIQREMRRQPSGQGTRLAS